MGSSSKFALALLVSSACLSAPAMVWAQAAAGPSPAPAASNDQAGGQAAIVVTATRRSERLLNVPISDTALTTKKLEEKQVTDVQTLSRVVPGMQVKPTLSPLEVTTAIRGIAQLIPEVSFDPAIGTYVDGVYYAIDAGSNAALIDMERVEVLKGPQGTLFGRNTIGGAISITTAKPTDEFGGNAQIDLGNYSNFIFTGVANLPVVPGKLDTRFVLQHSYHGGYGTDLVTGNPTSTLSQDYIRGSAKLTFNSDWNMLVTASYLHGTGFGPASHIGSIDVSGSPTSSPVPGLLPPLNFLLPAISGGPPGDTLSNYIGKGGWQDSFADIDNRFRINQYNATGTITGHLNDAVTVKSITGFNHTDYNTVSDLGGTPYAIIDLLHYPITESQVSEELQFYGNAMDNRLTWIAGAYFFFENGSQISVANALPALGALFGAPPTLNPQGPHINNTSYSGFGQITYEIMPGLHFTGGVRYVVDNRGVFYNDQVTTPVYPGGAFILCSLANAALANPANFAPTPTQGFSTNPAACQFNAKASFSYIPWTAGFDYKPNPNMMFYAKVSKGYRSGAFGLNGPVATAPSPLGPTTDPTAIAQAQLNDQNNINAFGAVAPEGLLSPEIGAKVDLLDHKLQVNAAFFYSWYDNIQAQINEPGPCNTCTPLNVLQNVGSAEMWGGELEVTAQVGKLSVDGQMGYVNPKYTSGLLVGQPFAAVSKFNTSITLSYPFELSAGTLTLTGTYAYQSSELLSTNAINLANTTTCAPGTSVGSPFNPCVRVAPFPNGDPATVAASQAALTQPGYGVLNMRATFRLRDFPVTFAVYGQNLTNVHYKTSATDFAPPISSSVFWPGAPLTFGGSIRYDF